MRMLAAVPKVVPAEQVATWQRFDGLWWGQDCGCLRLCGYRGTHPSR